MTKTEFIIDGSEFKNFEEFAEYFSKKILKDYEWRGSLDAFNDVLRGGFGTPEGGFILRWINSDLSRKNLGKDETVKWLDERTMNCHPSNRKEMKIRSLQMKNQIGPSLFDKIVEIIRIHGEGGEESEDGVELILE